MNLTPILNHCYSKCHVPYAVMSAPGYGKTAMIEHWCKTNNIPLVKIPVSAVDKGWILGIPAAEGDRTVTVSPEWAKTLNGRGVLFFDELDTASDEVQCAIRQLAEFRSFPNGEKLGDGVLIVAALNPPEVCGGHIDPSLKVCFMWHRMPVPSPEEALDWLIGKKDQSGDLPAPAGYLGKSEWLERFRSEPGFEADKKALLAQAAEMGMNFSAGQAAGELVNCPQTMENLAYWADDADEMVRWAGAFIGEQNAAILAAARNVMVRKAECRGE